MTLERDNLRAALGWSLRHDVQAGLPLAGRFGAFIAISSRDREGLDWLRKFLAAPENSAHTVARAKALLWGSDLLESGSLETDSLQQGHRWLEESLAIYRELDQPTGVAESLLRLGFFVGYKADWERSREYFAEGLQIIEAVGDKPRVALALVELGEDYATRGDTVQARLLYEKSLRIFRELGMKFAVAIPLWNLGILAVGDGDLAQARVYYEASAVIFRERGYETGLGGVLRNLSLVAARQGNFDEARDLIEGAMALARKYNLDHQLGFIFFCRGFIARAAGEYQQASEWYEKSLPLVGNRKFAIAHALEGLAGTWSLQGKTEHAARLFGAAAALREKYQIVLSPLRRSEVEHDLAVLRSALSEEAFAAAWKAGQAMTPEQAIEFALSRKDIT